ncbi:MAG: alpha/beta fold hydrolase [Candidatus Dormibacteria bacterium]
MLPAAVPTERRVQAGELKLSVREWSGSGRPIVCLHGLASNARWWDSVAAMLAPSHHVVAVDLRGHGQSDRPEHGYGFPEVARDLEALLDQLGLRAPVVVGHSWGASVALWLAAEVPEVAGVVCVDGGAMDLRAAFGDRWEVARERMRPPDMEHLDSARVREFVAASPVSEEIGAEAATEAMLGNFEAVRGGELRPRLGLDRHMQIARAFYELDQESLWRRNSSPVLFLMADDGSARMAPKRATVATAIRVTGGGAQAAFLTGAHDLPLQHPGLVAQAILEFCRVMAAEDRSHESHPEGRLTPPK